MSELWNANLAQREAVRRAPVACNLQRLIWKTGFDFANIDSMTKSADHSMPTLVEPMLPTLVKVPFSNPDWIFEPKWDGYRAICFLENRNIRFESKNRKSLTHRFPDLRSINKSIKAETAIIDGEIVALDKNGLPCFAGLRSSKATSECVIVFYAFDLLHLNGDDLTQKPVIERKALLKRILPKQHTGRVRYTEHIVGDGGRLFQELEKRQLEGMIAKRSDSLYVGGRTRAWLKVKTKAGKEEMQTRSETWGHPDKAKRLISTSSSTGTS